jgi:hypothetical protein
MGPVARLARCLRLAGHVSLGGARPACARRARPTCTPLTPWTSAQVEDLREVSVHVHLLARL